MRNNSICIATWMELEISTLSEVRKKKTDEQEEKEQILIHAHRALTEIGLKKWPKQASFILFSVKERMLYYY